MSGSLDSLETTWLTLRRAMEADPNDARRRLHLLGLVAQEYAAYEDAAALLKAWLAWRAGTTATPLEHLFGYQPGEARLDKVFADFAITTGEDLLRALDVTNWLPTEWSGWFPALNLEKTAGVVCRFLAEDCRRHQKKLGVAAFNKIKHGLFVVPSARSYLPALPDAPAALIANQDLATAPSKPYVVYALPADDNALRERERSVHFVGRSLRLLAALYLLHRFPAMVKAAWGGSGHAMFLSPDLADIIELVADVTATK
jgi:hypothetical protein